MNLLKIIGAIVFLLALIFGFLTYQDFQTAKLMTGISETGLGTGQTYYFSSSTGDDTNTCLDVNNPCRTTSKLFNLSASGGGDSFLFKCGDIWRLGETGINTGGKEYGGTSTAWNRYSSYGDCNSTNKPILRGSINLNSTASWIDRGSNIWEANWSENEQGAQMFANVSKMPTGKPDLIERVPYLSNLSVRGLGYFFTNYTIDSLSRKENSTYIYSVGNPYTVYGDIEFVLNTQPFYPWVRSDSYIVFENLTIEFFGHAGFNSVYAHNLIIRNMDVHYIGGGYNGGDGSSSYDWGILGNAIQIWDDGVNISVYNNKIHDISDAALTPQGSNANRNLTNQEWFNNTIWNVGYGFEMFHDGGIGNISVHHNTFYDMDSGVYNQQRSRTDEAADQRCFIISDADRMTNFTFKDNICYESDQFTYSFRSPITSNLNYTGNWSFNYNYVWRNTSTGLDTDMIRTYSGTSTTKDYATLALWKAAYPVQDTYSLSAGGLQFVNSNTTNPLAVDLTPLDYQQVCGSGSDNKQIGVYPCKPAVYVNISHASCSDSNTRLQAENPSTPWCSLDAPLTNDKLLSGDTLFVATGEYNGESDITNWVITANTTIKSATNNNVNLTRYWGNKTVGTANGSNTLWTNKSSGRWETTYATSDDTDCYPRVHYEDHTHLFHHSDYANFLNCNYTSGCAHYGRTNHTLYIYLASGDPNNVKLFISTQCRNIDIHNMTTTNDAYLNIDGFNMEYGVYGVWIDDSTSVIVENNNIKDMFRAVLVRRSPSLPTQTNKPIIVRNNNMTGGFNKYWITEDLKASSSSEESDLIRTQEYYGPLYVYNNYFSNLATAVSQYNNHSLQGNGTKVYNNRIDNNFGTAFEIEDYSYNSEYYNNNITNCNYAGFSFAPAYCASPDSCKVYNNLVACNGSHYETACSGGVCGGWAIKAENRSTIDWSHNWNFSHNTFYGAQRSLYGMNAGIWNKTRFTDNIFYSDGDYTLLYTSLATRGVFFDYNLYYLEPTGDTCIFRRWNTDGAVCLYSLSEALASAYWDGTWDVNSIEAEPSLNANFEPSTNSPACGEASDGGDIGALPCVVSNIYVNISHASCSDSNTRSQAQNPSSPWCTLTNVPSLLEDADGVIVANGEYRDENTWDIAKRFNETVTITGQSLATRISGAFANSTWTNASNSSHNIWTRSYATGSTTVGCYYNQTPYFPYDTYAYLVDLNNPEGTFWNNTPDTLFIRLNAGLNPNTMNIQCFKAYGTSITSTSNIVFDTLNFSYALRVFLTDLNTTNITVKNSYFTGGLTGLGLIYVRNGSDITITNNTFYINPPNWTWGFLKNGGMEDFSVEMSAINVQNIQSVAVTQNNVSGFFNGIFLGDTSEAVTTNINITHNTIQNIYDDSIEIEGHFTNLDIAYNNVSDAFVGISLAPANCTTSYSCKIRYNIINTSKVVPYNTTYDMQPYFLKYEDLSSINTTGWNVTKNTFVSNYNGLADYGGRTTKNMRYTDNIFISPNRLLYGTGLATQRVYFNNNVYFTSGSLFSNYWNNDTGTKTSLALAKASTYWDGTWDTNSFEGNPVLTNYVPTDYACNTGSDGRDIGALPCAEVYIGIPGFICNKTGCSSESALIGTTWPLSSAMCNRIECVVI